MSKEYDNTNRGALFKNEEKQNPKHADYNGSIDVNGEEFWLNGWAKTSSKGTRYLSLSIKPKNGAKAEVKAGRAVPFDDDVPFGPEWRG